MTMSRTKRIAIGMLDSLWVGISHVPFLFQPPFSLIITSIVVVLVLDWLWNRGKKIEYTQDGNETSENRQKKSET